MTVGELAQWLADARASGLPSDAPVVVSSRDHTYRELDDAEAIDVSEGQHGGLDEMQAPGVAYPGGTVVRALLLR